MSDAVDLIPVLLTAPAPGACKDHSAAPPASPAPGRRLTGSERRAIITNDRLALAAAFPAAFSKPGGISPKRPLKICIHVDVIARGVVGLDGRPLSINRIRRAIHDYMIGPRYARGLLGFDERIDLDGEPAGPISLPARQKAETRIEEHARAERRKREIRKARSQRRAEARAEAMADA